jgi:sec-independent protein translocase protein TatA
MVGDILQPTHLVFVLVVALLVLGPKRLPEVGRQLGNGLRDFRSAINGEHSDLRSAITGEHSEPPQTRAPYEEPASETPAEHEFAPAAETTATADGHEFAHADAETVAPEHQFAHAEAGTAAPEHEFAHAEAQTAAPEHQFAHETSESADKRPDPLA